MLLATAVNCIISITALNCTISHYVIMWVDTHLVVRAGVPILMPPGVIADTSPGMVFCECVRQRIGVSAVKEMLSVAQASTDSMQA